MALRPGVIDAQTELQVARLIAPDAKVLYDWYLGRSLEGLLSKRLPGMEQTATGLIATSSLRLFVRRDLDISHQPPAFWAALYQLVSTAWRASARNLKATSDLQYKTPMDIKEMADWALWLSEQSVITGTGIVVGAFTGPWTGVAATVAMELALKKTKSLLIPVPDPEKAVLSAKEYVRAMANDEYRDYLFGILAYPGIVLRAAATLFPGDTRSNYALLLDGLTQRSAMSPAQGRALEAVQSEVRWFTNKARSDAAGVFSGDPVRAKATLRAYMILTSWLLYFSGVSEGAKNMAEASIRLDSEIPDTTSGTRFWTAYLDMGSKIVGSIAKLTGDTVRVDNDTASSVVQKSLDKVDAQRKSDLGSNGQWNRLKKPMMVIGIIGAGTWVLYLLTRGRSSSAPSPV